MKRNNNLTQFSFVLIALSVLVAACAETASTPSSSDGDGSGGTGSTATPTPTPTPKAIANVWTNSVGAALVLNLTNANTNGSSFTASLTYDNSVCTMVIEMGTNNTSGNCTITATPTFNGVTSGFSATDCTENVYNICGSTSDSASAYPQSGEYSWDGTGLSFQNNQSQYR